MGPVKSRQEAAPNRAQRKDSIKAVQTMSKDGRPELSLREASKAFGTTIFNSPKAVDWSTTALHCTPKSADSH